jgi:hypothetical protein
MKQQSLSPELATALTTWKEMARPKPAEPRNLAASHAVFIAP